MSCRLLAVTLLLSSAPVASLGAQDRCVAAVDPIPLITNAGYRLATLRAPDANGRDLLHDAVRCIAPGAADTTTRLAVRASWPSVLLQANGGLPDPRRDGALWAGRGASVLARGGLLADAGHLHVALVPEVRVAQNLPFESFPGTDSARSSFASPFQTGESSMDFPTRMGADPTREIGLGESAVWVSGTHVAGGFSSSTQLWGSGRDGLLLGANASGVPRVFVRTEQPFETRVGQWSGMWFAGRVTESPYFDRDPTNDQRNLSAAALMWTPARSRALTMVLARAVMTPRAADAAMLDGWSAAFRPVATSSGDELTSLMTAVHLPEGRLRAWVELAHQGPLRLRELLTVPTANLAYRMGLEHAVERASGAWLLHGEAANLEQSQDILDRPQHDFYAGYATPQGWTQRGQLLGDGAGPGGQTQFLSADWITPRWRAGLFGERLRQNEDALFRQYLPLPNRHDVTVRAGVALGYEFGGYDLSVEASSGKRLNYLFQNTIFLTNYRTVDVPLRELRLTITPHWSPRR